MISDEGGRRTLMFRDCPKPMLVISNRITKSEIILVSFRTSLLRFLNVACRRGCHLDKNAC